MSQDLFLLDFGCGGDGFEKSTLGGDIAVDREHILLRVVLVPIIDFPVHMDGQVGDQHQIPVHIDQTGDKMPVLLHDHPAGDR